MDEIAVLDLEMMVGIVLIVFRIYAVVALFVVYQFLKERRINDERG